MPKVVVRDGESLEAALQRFRRGLEKTGRLRDARRRERYEKPSDRRRRRNARSRRRGR
ncbi:MAG: 30S ribosomal protein S21 [Armatimonadota bacterium]